MSELNAAQLDELERLLEQMKLPEHPNWIPVWHALRNAAPVLIAAARRASELETALAERTAERDEALATLKEHEDECWCFNPIHGSVARDLQSALIERDAAREDTARRCCEIIDKIPEGTMFLLDTAILRIRKEFGIDAARAKQECQ